MSTSLSGSYTRRAPTPQSTGPQFEPAQAQELYAAFLEFASHVRIDSKDEGRVRFEPFMGQLRFFETVFDGLENDIHWFVVLKARQLGLTTGSILLDLFWISMFSGLQGAIITDTPGNMQKLRLLITRILEDLPDQYKIGVYQHNRDGLVLLNGSSLDYLSAGSRKNSGLARSRAYMFLHATEVSSWGDAEGYQSLIATLSDKYPARLYIFESTAKGYSNLFYSVWEEAKSDELTRRGLFIGWWAKESYQFARNTKLFARYGEAAPSSEERELMQIVFNKYDHAVTMEQLAWYRWKKDPAAVPEDGMMEDDGATNSIVEQEFPWHEEQAFMTTGSSFFPSEAISEAHKIAIEKPLWVYRYSIGGSFLATVLEPVKSVKHAHLRVWEEPVEGATYVIGADPAQGSSEESDRSCAQVFRCYADGLDQVAEFATNQVQAYQFAWVLAHLCGAYNNALYILELQGGGEATMKEMRDLQALVVSGSMNYAMDKENEGRGEGLRGVRAVIPKIRSYIYSRPDSMIGSGSWHWKTTMQNKFTIYNQFRDGFTLGDIKIYSVECLNEMKHITQTGMSVRAEGAYKDDRPMGVALAQRAWRDSIRASLIGAKRTRENEVKKEMGTLTKSDMQNVFMQGLIVDYFAKQQKMRAALGRKAKRVKW